MDDDFSQTQHGLAELQNELACACEQEAKMSNLVMLRLLKAQKWGI
jgi:hypothetical protein